MNVATATRRSSPPEPISLGVDRDLSGERTQDPPPPAQPGREPGGEPRPVTDRDHPDERPPRDRAYVQRRTAEGLSKKEMIRCLKRYVARQVYPCLRPGAWPQAPGAA